MNPAGKPKSLRFAIALSLMLPGAGQLYTGQTALGIAYATGFITSFITMLTVFLRAYARYLELSTSGDILAANNLEQLTQLFPYKLLIGLAVLSLAIYLAAPLSLRLPRKN